MSSSSSSKLDYLSKYLGAAPAEVQKKKDKKRAKAMMSSTFRIRDETELIPEAKSIRRRLELNEVTVVEEEDTKLSEKPKHETSGVQWNTANSSAPPVFQKRKNAPASSSVRRTRCKISEESDEEDASPPRTGRQKAKRDITVDDDGTADLSPPRQKNARRKLDSDGDLSPPRGKPNRRDGDGDLSPPRGKPQAARKDSDADLSPPRQKNARDRQDSDADLSPPRQKTRQDSDGDMSPPRGKPNRDADGDLSLPRQKNARKDPGGDTSPPRGKPKPDADGDLSPPRGKPRRDANGDLSPPRGKRSRDADGDLSPPRGKPKRDADGDLSPPRGKPKRDADGDLSPPRGKPKRDADGDLSPPRGKPKRDADGDLSPPREKPKRDADGDLSPPRRQAPRDADGDLSPPRQDKKKAAKMSSGLSAGLQSTETLKEESARIRERGLDSALARESKGAETVFRDKTGKKVTKEEWTKIQEAKKKRRRNVPDQVLEWGRGLVQKQSLEDKQDEAAKVALEPFSRFEVTKEYDAELAEKDRWNDPMAKYMEKKATEETAIKERAEEKARPKCRFPGPPNRFGIQPGYRWDGKIRGNGFEQKYFKAKNNRQHEKQVVSKFERDDW